MESRHRMRTFEDAASKIRYKDWILRLGEDFIQWVWYGEDVITGEPTYLSSRKWRISEFMTESEFVQTCFAAALQAEEHECREAFTYGEYRPFHPHINLDALCEASLESEVRDEIERRDFIKQDAN